MTNPTPKPSTTPPTSSVDWEQINSNWETTKNLTPLQIVEKHIKHHEIHGSSGAVLEALHLVWSDVWFLHGGGHEKMKEKK